jgi:hypothetical protein
MESVSQSVSHSFSLDDISKVILSLVSIWISDCFSLGAAVVQSV